MAKTYGWKSPALLTAVMVWTMSVQALMAFGVAVLDFGFGDASQYSADTPDFTPLQALHALLDVGGLLLFVTIVIALFWHWRVAKNARTFSRRMEDGVLWGPFWYAVPIASLFKPFQVMAEIWTASGGRSLTLLRWWWGFYLGWNLISVGLRFGAPPAWLDGLMHLAWTFSTVTYVAIASNLSKMQISLHQTAVFSDDDAIAPRDAVLNF
jgi:hypothetical protein